MDPLVLKLRLATNMRSSPARVGHQILRILTEWVLLVYFCWQMTKLLSVLTVCSLASWARNSYCEEIYHVHLDRTAKADMDPEIACCFGSGWKTVKSILAVMLSLLVILQERPVCLKARSYRWQPSSTPARTVSSPYFQYDEKDIKYR